MVEAIVRDVNCVGVLNSKMAKSFNANFPENDLAFRDEFARGNVEPGKLFVFDRGDEKTPKFIFNLPSRVHWKAPIKPQYLNDGIQSVVEAAIRRRVNRVKIYKFEEPNPTSSDSITWEKIKLAFLTSFARVPDVQLEFLDRGIRKGARKQVTIFTDGGVDHNLGVGGYGIVLRYGDTMKEMSQGFQCSTSNRMELLAAVVGLESLKESCDVRLYSDSRYVVDPVVNGTLFRWREKRWRKRQGKVKNVDLWERFAQAYVRHQVECVWVKGHSGIADNERCDELASLAIVSSDLQVDQGFIDSTPQKGNSPADSKLQTVAAAKRGPKPKKAGDPCRHCATPLVRRKTKKSNPKSTYYFPWHLHCQSCNRFYHVESAKVYRNKGAE